MIKTLETKKLSGKVALVTGAGRGLGRGYALRLAALGAHVVVTDINMKSYKEYKKEAEQMTGNTTSEEIKKLGVKSFEFEMDVTDEEACKEVVNKVIEKLGRIDIVICNAGGGGGDLTDSMASSLDLKQTQEIMNRNFFGTVNICKAVAPIFKEQNTGKIVTVSSVAGLFAKGKGAYAHYSAAKAAIVAYTRNLAQELGPYNINVNCLAPGHISTGRLEVQFNKKGVDEIKSTIALKRLGTVEDCSNTIEFLTTNLSDYVTGQVIPVCGGVVLGPS